MKSNRNMGERLVLVASRLLLGMVASAILINSFQTVVAQDFRVDNRVFLEDKEEPEIETTTFFHGSIVYDRIKDDGEITIYDPSRERIILMDPQREVRVETTCEAIHDFIRNYRQSLNQQEGSYIRFLANPRFQTTFDQETSLLELNSPLVTYRILTESTDEEMAVSYRQFTDWTSMLSAMTQPGATPPFARMKVNEELVSRNFLPKEIYLTLRPDGSSIMSSPIMLRSEHDFRSGLSESELRQIAGIGSQMAAFEKITLDEFVRNRGTE
jgi:hypothetical protein